MSEFAFFRFRSNNMLTIEEKQHKDEIVELTEEILEAKGIECDSKIKISEQKLREILEEVRKLRRKRKRLQTVGNTTSNIENEEGEIEQHDEEVPYIK
jgi:hypothetical protein